MTYVKISELPQADPITGAESTVIVQGGVTKRAAASDFIGPEGPQGAKGDTGATGPQGPQGVKGDTGADGATGPAGPIGPQGPAGADGSSAYQVAVANGFVGTEAQWLASLVGPQGEQGEQGVQGIQGPKGETGATGPAGTTSWVGITDKPTTIAGFGITDAEPAIAAPGSAPAGKYWRGDKTWRDFFTDVRAATLTGLSDATSAAVAATDTVLSAVGKLQAQVTAKVSKSGDTMTGALTLASEVIPLTVNNLPTIRPSLLLDFANSRSVDQRITFARATPATRTNEKGLIETVAANVPRLDFDPVTGECKGLLIEEARTNLLLNSLIDGTNLGTQTVNVTAVAHTLSFYGAGSVTLSGAHSATVTGTGAYPARQVLMFTPTAGSLVLTVTGDVKFAQLEVGTFPTSFTPTGAAQVTRAADIATMTGANFSSWYRQDEGTVFCDVVATNYVPQIALDIGAGGAFGTTAYVAYSVDKWELAPDFAPINVSSSVSSTPTAKIAAAIAANNSVLAVNGVVGAVDTNCTPPPSPTQLSIGRGGWSGAITYLNGHVRRLAYYTKRLANTELQAITTP